MNEKNVAVDYLCNDCGGAGRTGNGPKGVCKSCKGSGEKKPQAVQNPTPAVQGDPNGGVPQGKPKRVKKK